MASQSVSTTELGKPSASGVELAVDEIGVSLRYATVAVTKTIRNGTNDHIAVGAATEDS